jgi:hypothetical protein
MRSRQHFVAGQTHLIISRAQCKFDQFCNGAPNCKASVSSGDKHPGHFTFSIVETLYCAGADDSVFGNRTKKNRSVAVHSFRIIDVPTKRE